MTKTEPPLSRRVHPVNMQQAESLIAGMGRMPITLEQARQAAGFTDSIVNVLQNEEKRAVLFALHAMLCRELYHAHRHDALEAMEEARNEINPTR